MSSAAGAGLRALFGPGRLQERAPLAPLTTFRIGGAADYLLDGSSVEEALRAAEHARRVGLAVTVLGGGSNVLIPDEGVRGLVIRMRAGEVRRLGPAVIRADAGVTINGLVRWTINRGLAGLEAWAGTPGTVGGAVYGNAHFRGRNIGELIERVVLLDPGGVVREVPAEQMEFAYDYSRLHRSREIVLAADFRVSDGDSERLRTVARESLKYRKGTQPLASPSAGCIFQNPDPQRDQVPDGIPWSAGALIDRAGLKGVREGQARVSPTHGNFIINEGGATAADVRRLMDRCKREVRERFGVELREEIVYFGVPGGASGT